MGLADRHYMRDDWNRPRLSMSFLVMIVIFAAFVLQQINHVYIQSRVEFDLLLSTDGLKHGHLWQLLTFQFMHGGLMHVLFNLLGIWFFGRFVERRLGGMNFLKIYFASGFVGGLLQAGLGFLFPNHFGGPVLGASAGVCGVFAAFTMIEPRAQILLWFVLPVRAVYLLVASIAIALLFTIVPSEPGVAHAAHLGGLLAGVAFMRWQLYALRRLNLRLFQNRDRKRELVKTAAKTGYVSPRVEPENLPSEEFISREVDPILDKISAQGIQSLTERERKILEAARKKIVKR
jgi:membrane associated rhomboid family serine protease